MAARQTIIFSLWVALVCPLIAWAEPPLVCPLEFAHLSKFNLNRHPRLRQFLASPIAARLHRSQPKSFRELEDEIAYFGSDIFLPSLETKDFKLDFELERKGNTFSVTIQYLGLKNGPDREVVNLRGRSHEDPMGFPRLITAICAGLERQIANHPGIEKIVINGGTVVNRDLADRLEKFGFSPSGKWKNRKWITDWFYYDVVGGGRDWRLEMDLTSAQAFR